MQSHSFIQVRFIKICHLKYCHLWRKNVLFTNQWIQLYNLTFFFFLFLLFDWPKQCSWLKICFLSRCILSFIAHLCTWSLSKYRPAVSFLVTEIFLRFSLAQGREPTEERENGKVYGLQRQDPYCVWQYLSSILSNEIQTGTMGISYPLHWDWSCFHLGAISLFQ